MIGASYTAVSRPMCFSSIWNILWLNTKVFLEVLNSHNEKSENPLHTSQQLSSLRMTTVKLPHSAQSHWKYSSPEGLLYVSGLYQDASLVNRNIATGLADHKIMSVPVVVFSWQGNQCFYLCYVGQICSRAITFCLTASLCVTQVLLQEHHGMSKCMWRGALSAICMHCLSPIAGFTNTFSILLKNKDFELFLNINANLLIDFYQLRLVWNRLKLSYSCSDPKQTFEIVRMKSVLV